MKTKAITYLLILLMPLLPLLPLAAVAQSSDEQKHEQHQQQQQTRQFDKEKLHDYRSQNSFDYGNEAHETNSIKRWLLNQLSQILKTIFSDQGVAPYIRYAVATIILILVIYFLFRKQLSGLFGINNNNKKTLSFNIVEDDIHEPELERKLREAISNGEYRQALRLNFVILLRELSQSKHINWQIDKTNKQYSTEIQNNDIRQHFVNLAHNYDFVWYGEFDLLADQYQQLQNEFNQVTKML